MAPINGGNEGELMRLFFLFRWELRGDRGGGARPAAAAPCTPGVGAGGGRRSARAGPAERLSGLAGRVGRERVAWAGRQAKAGEGEAGRLGRERLPGRRVGRAESKERKSTNFRIKI
jgi:hypothetical protein